jgi:hypothetical protein
MNSENNIKKFYNDSNKVIGFGSVTQEEREEKRLNDIKRYGIGYSGYCDKTVLSEITATEKNVIEFDSDENKQQIDQFTQSAHSVKECELEKTIQAGIKLLESFHCSRNHVWNNIIEQKTMNDIKLGELLIALKQLVKKSLKKEKNITTWIVWQKENITFMDVRYCQKLMQMAKRKDAHRYAFLGKEKLLRLISATENREDEDKIGSFLKDNDIQVSPDMNLNIDEFELMLETAVANELLKKDGVQVDLELLRSLVCNKIKVDQRLSKKLKLINENDGDPEQYLSKILNNQGSEASKDETHKKFDSIKKLASKMMQSLKNLHKKPDLMTHVEIDQIDDINKIITELYELKFDY